MLPALDPTLPILLVLHLRSTVTTDPARFTAATRLLDAYRTAYPEAVAITVQSSADGSPEGLPGPGAAHDLDRALNSHGRALRFPTDQTIRIVSPGKTPQAPQTVYDGPTRKPFGTLNIGSVQAYARLLGDNPQVLLVTDDNQHDLPADWHVVLIPSVDPAQQPDRALTPELLSLLGTYSLTGQPRIWDDAALVPGVRALHAAGLITPARENTPAAFRLTLTGGLLLTPNDGVSAVHTYRAATAALATRLNLFNCPDCGGDGYSNDGSDCPICSGTGHTRDDAAVQARWRVAESAVINDPIR